MIKFSLMANLLKLLTNFLLLNIYIYCYELQMGSSSIKNRITFEDKITKY